VFLPTEHKINDQIKVLGTALLGPCMKAKSTTTTEKPQSSRGGCRIGGAISTLIASRNGLHRSLKFFEAIWRGGNDEIRDDSHAIQIGPRKDQEHDCRHA
jgi:hypothetical protein